MKPKNPNRMQSFINRIENSDKRFGWIILIVYIAALSVVSYFHEPWFDEAQSWIVARDVPIKDIIFFIPHYEGHPPLWHLYLVPFARMGLPYEMGIKFAAIIINTIAMGLVIFKAPFKKIIRYAIPFTYYFFFLYGVVSRCYSFTMLGFILMAMTYNKRNEKPYLYVLSMILVCLSTAYGIILCGGIAAIWLFEILKEHNSKGTIKNIVKDQRVYSLGVLLISALMLAYLMMPNKDTYAVNVGDDGMPLVYKIIFLIILAPLDATFFTTIQGNYLLAQYSGFPHIITIITGIFMFLILSVCLYIMGRGYKKLAMLIIPYSLFAVFAGYFYFSEHHVSIIAYFLLFWFWICFDSDEKFELPLSISNRLKHDDMKKFNKIVWFFPMLLIAIPLYWNISACALEINTNYCSAREAAEFIEEYDLEDKLIMHQWEREKLEDGTYKNIISMQSTPAILAYFDKNIFYTFNNGDDALCYNTHIIPSGYEVAEAFEKWESLGPPDILIDDPDLISVFNKHVTYDDYALVKVIPERRITKDDFTRNNRLLTIYMHIDLLDHYDIDIITDEEWKEIVYDNYIY